MGEEAFDRSDWRAVIDGHALESHDPAEWLRYGVALLHGLEPGPEQGRQQQQQAGLAFVKAQQEGASAVAVETAQRLALLQLMAEACDLSGLSAAAGVAQQQIEHLRHRLNRDQRHSGRTVIHTIHHFACTGGTVICKCLASMHRVALVSEVNPLSRFSSDFEPRDPLIMLEKSYRHLTPEEIKEDFLSRMALAVKICLRDGMDLVIRDHSHTDFCMGKAVSKRTPILEFLQDDYDLVSVVTLRHPLDSYLGLRAVGWHDQFTPSSLDEYSKRYLTFLDRYSAFPWRRYEDFCAQPERFLQELCSLLELEFRADFLDRFGEVHLSGDSGRSSGDSICLRPRRHVPEDVQEEIETSENYRQLLEIMGYVS